MVGDADADTYAALVLPGGVANPDALRMDEDAVDFVRAFVESGKPVAAICHAPWTLVEADVVRGKRVTSWPSLQTDLRNAGAEWVDEEVVVDGNLVTSRNPDDLPAFNEKLLELLDVRVVSTSSQWFHSVPRWPVPLADHEGRVRQVLAPASARCAARPAGRGRRTRGRSGTGRCLGSNSQSRNDTAASRR